jgi:hypothetical protein
MMAERFYNKWSRADFVFKSALAAVRSCVCGRQREGGRKRKREGRKARHPQHTGINHLTPISLLSPPSLQAAVIPVIKGGAMARDAQAAERLVVPTKYVRGWKKRRREGGRNSKGRKAR